MGGLRGGFGWGAVVEGEKHQRAGSGGSTGKRPTVRRMKRGCQVAHLLVGDAGPDVHRDLDDLLGELLGQVLDAGAALAAVGEG